MLVRFMVIGLLGVMNLAARPDALLAAHPGYAFAFVAQARCAPS
jgi:K+ transporter